MNLLDVLILVVTALAILGGYRLGFLARSLSWIGLLVAMLLAIRFTPDLVRSLSGATPRARLFAVLAFVIGLALLGQAVGLAAGGALRRRLGGGARISSIDRAAGMMSPASAERFKNEFAAVAKDLGSRNVSAQASTVSAGVEAIGPDAASVAVILRGTQSSPGKQPDTAVLALRVALSKTDGRWVVEDVSPIHSR